MITSLAFVNSLQTVVSGSNTVLKHSVTLSTSTTTPQVTASANFPPVGSVTRDYSEAGLEKLWDIVGPVQPPPFTTTRVPDLPIAIPSAPPALYPSWFSPSPKDILPDLKLPKTPIPFRTKPLSASPLKPHALCRISWARIFPFGTADSPVNQEGLDHYSDLIDYHIQSGVEPVATLSYYGGFTSPKVVDDFVNYAKTVFKAYNGRVKTWYTFNEPRVYCSQVGGYPFNASLAPGVNSSTAPYQCSSNVLKAHLGAVQAFREMNIQGEISFKNDDFVGIPWRANNSEDIAAVERHAAFRIGVFSDPVFATGDWPKIMTDTLPPSYLPRFSEEEKENLRGTGDFYAIDAYRTQYVAAPEDGLASCVNNTSHPLWPECHTVVLYDSNAGWAAGPSPDPLSAGWLQATPNFLRASLLELQSRWPTNKMGLMVFVQYISEFGFVEPFEDQWTDLFRITEDVTRTSEI
ncbi:hypothetical protein H0H93_002010 [Arthromyces matolae]|nr:hypothetical protein H0H93_002010 [Arthromyces matolae]